MSSVQQVISAKRAALAKAIESPLKAIADALTTLWEDVEAEYSLMKPFICVPAHSIS